MPDIEVSIEIYCYECGAGLCGNATATTVRGRPCFQVEPCDKCEERKYDEGYAAGLEEGRAMR